MCYFRLPQKPLTLTWSRLNFCWPFDKHTMIIKLWYSSHSNHEASGLSLYAVSVDRRRNKHTPSSENHRGLMTSDGTQFDYFVADISIKANNIVAQVVAQRPQDINARWWRWRKTFNDHRKQSPFFFSVFISVPKRIIYNQFNFEAFNEWMTSGCLYQYFRIDSHWQFYSGASSNPSSGMALFLLTCRSSVLILKADVDFGQNYSLWRGGSGSKSTEFGLW